MKLASGKNSRKLLRTVWGKGTRRSPCFRGYVWKAATFACCRLATLRQARSPGGRMRPTIAVTELMGKRFGILLRLIFFVHCSEDPADQSAKAQSGGREEYSRRVAERVAYRCPRSRPCGCITAPGPHWWLEKHGSRGAGPACCSVLKYLLSARRNCSDCFRTEHKRRQILARRLESEGKERRGTSRYHSFWGVRSHGLAVKNSRGRREQ